MTYWQLSLVTVRDTVDNSYRRMNKHYTGQKEGEVFKKNKKTKYRMKTEEGTLFLLDPSLVLAAVAASARDFPMKNFTSWVVLVQKKKRVNLG